MALADLNALGEGEDLLVEGVYLVVVIILPSSRLDTLLLKNGSIKKNLLRFTKKTILEKAFIFGNFLNKSSGINCRKYRT